MLGSLHLFGEEGGQEEMTRGVQDPGCQELCAILNGDIRWGGNMGPFIVKTMMMHEEGRVSSSPFGLDLTRPRDSTTSIILPKKMGVVLAFCALPLG